MKFIDKFNIFKYFSDIFTLIQKKLRFVPGLVDATHAVLLLSQGLTREWWRNKRSNERKKVWTQLYIFNKFMEQPSFKI